MEKGKYGITLNVIAIIAFALGLFGFLEALILVVGFSLIGEKNQWLTKQVLQALFLRIAYSLGTTIVNWLFIIINTLLKPVRNLGVISGTASVQAFLNGILYIALLVFTILAVLKLLKQKDAEVPFISKLADCAMGVVHIKPEKEPKPEPAYTYSPPTPTNTDQEISSSNVWQCSCGHDNTGNFCMKCGTSRNS